MSTLYETIKKPVITEKSTGAGAETVVFRVALGASKGEIRAAAEKLFNVRVASVNTAVMPGKPKRFGRSQGRRAPWKKAILTLVPGQTLALFDGDGAEPVREN